MSNDATISLSYTDDAGNVVRTPHMPMSAVRAALDQMSARTNQAAAPATDNLEMFTSDETGERRMLSDVASRLRALIERIERLEADKKDIADDIKAVYSEAKGSGFDTNAMRAIVRLRRKDAAKRDEEEAILDLYRSALGV